MKFNLTTPQKAYRVKVDINSMENKIDIYVYVIKFIQGLEDPCPDDPECGDVVSLSRKISIDLDVFYDISDKDYLSNLIEKTANELYDSKI